MPNLEQAIQLVYPLSSADSHDVSDENRMQRSNLFVWFVRLGRLLEEGRQDAVGPLEGRKVVRAVELAQRHRLGVDDQRLHLHGYGYSMSMPPGRSKSRVGEDVTIARKQTAKDNGS